MTSRFCLGNISPPSCLLQREAVLKATAVRSPLQRCNGVNVINSSLFINSSWSSLSSTSHAVFCRRGVWPGGVWPGGGSGQGGGRGHFGPAAIYCITTWCFALKGLRTTLSCKQNLFLLQSFQMYLPSGLVVVLSWLTLFCKVEFDNQANIFRL